MKFALYMHGDYKLIRNQRVSCGDIIGTSNGKFNFIPHNHVSILEGEFFSINDKGNKVINFFKEKPWHTINPFNFINDNNIPNSSFKQAGGYSYLEKTPYNWYLGLDPSLHDGIDFSVNSQVGENLYSIVNGIVLDAYQDEFSSYLLIRIDEKSIEETSITKGDNIMLDYNKRFLVKFTNLDNSFLNTYCDSSCSVKNETLKVFNNESYYITKEVNTGNYILELSSFYIVFIKREAVEQYSEYV